MKDYYKILSIPASASAEKIEEAYYLLTTVYTSGKNRNNQQAVARVKEITEAYQLLSDPDKRKIYDRRKEIT